MLNTPNIVIKVELIIIALLREVIDMETHVLEAFVDLDLQTAKMLILLLKFEKTFRIFMIYNNI